MSILRWRNQPCLSHPRTVCAPELQSALEGLVSMLKWLVTPMQVLPRLLDSPFEVISISKSVVVTITECITQHDAENDVELVTG